MFRNHLPHYASRARPVSGNAGNASGKEKWHNAALATLYHSASDFTSKTHNFLPEFLHFRQIADARRDYAERWNTEFNREASIWEETNVIGVTAPIYNDTISVSKNSEIMDDALIAALQNAFINIGNTDEGKQVIAIYSHNGYQKAQSSDYDNERAAQKLIQELTAAN
mgnify:CR=1 FL=1